MLGRVRHVDAKNQTVDLELRNGNVILHHMDGEDNFTPGEVVLIGPSWDDVEVVPQALWPEEPWVAVVSQILDTEVLINLGGRLKAIRKPDGLQLEKGYTVEGVDSRGITSLGLSLAVDHGC